MEDIEKRELFKDMGFLKQIVKQFINLSDVLVRDFGEDTFKIRGGVTNNNTSSAYYLVTLDNDDIDYKIYLITPPLYSQSILVDEKYQEDYLISKAHQVEHGLLDLYESTDPKYYLDFNKSSFFILCHKIFDINTPKESEMLLFLNCSKVDFCSYLYDLREKGNLSLSNFLKDLY